MASKDKRLKGFFIFVTDKGKALEPELVKLADLQKANEIALTHLSPKDGGVGAYKINLDPAVKNTVMLYRRKRIKSKEVNLIANDAGLARLKKDIDELLAP